MDWTAFIRGLEERSGQVLTLGTPVSTADLDALETEFGLKLPADYRAFMLEVGGLDDEYGCPVIDSLADVLAVNRDIRSDSHLDYLPLHHFLFISSAYGNGDLVGYGRSRNGEVRPHLFRWDHETDSRELESPDLRTWLERSYGESLDSASELDH